MKLYHGGYTVIEHPDCLAGRENLDFGKGFYTTLMREHAEQWAGQVAFNRGRLKPILNVYEFDMERAVSEYSYRFSLLTMMNGWTSSFPAVPGRSRGKVMTS